jgi:FlaA1/EpsC-like NDP-sugar epimerase
MKRSQTIVAWVLKLPRSVKRLIALGLDGFICIISVYVAFYLRLGFWTTIYAASHPMIASIAIGLPIFVSFGLYRAIFRHAGWYAVLSVARAVALYSVPFFLIYTIVGIHGIPRTIGIIQPILLFLMIAASRLIAGVSLGDAYKALWNNGEIPRVLIYGAGAAGRQIASAIRAGTELRVAGFIDDDAALWRSTIDGMRVYSPAELPRVISRTGVTDILLAVPSASRARRTEIMHALRHLDLHVRTLPGLLDMARGSVSVSDLRDVEIEDLLGRPPVPPNEDLLQKNIREKVVLVTGAGGSIGSELCRQIAAARPALLLLLEASEYNLYSIHQELTRQYAASDLDPITVIPLLGSVCDAMRVREIMAAWEPDTIFHAAAYKHVPLVENNVLEGIRNNVLGTRIMASLAKEYGVASFVLISTDKAVRPTNVMGTTKRLAELVLQSMQDDAQRTCFSMVRFGNVLGSSGSVVPLFRNQIARGGPITLTHPDITRYFMTIPEAAQLVLQAGAMAKGGDVFVLDMGEPVRIIDLARNIIELSGLSVRDERKPDGDIEIRIVGIRPGEKLYEELLIGGDPAPTDHPRIMRSHEAYLPWPHLSRLLKELENAIERRDVAGAADLIGRIVPEYSPSTDLVDLVTDAKSADDTLSARSLAG